MDAKAILEELLETGSNAARKGVSLAEEKLGVPEEGEDRKAMLEGMTKGALTVGAIALLLGTGGGRKLTGSAIKLGGLAALGGLAYKSFTEWQAQQGHTEVVHNGTPIGDLDRATADQRATLLIRAMILAARADGHIDAQERQNIHAQIRELELGQEAADFLLTEIDKPLDPDALAESVDSIDAAIELYLVSAMVVDIDLPEEKKYLDQLARSLQLAPSLVKTLERNLRSE